MNFARDGCVIQDKYLLCGKWGPDSEVNGGCRERTMRRIADSQSGTG